MHGIVDIGRAYAAALFELATESDMVDIVREDLSALVQVAADGNEFLTVYSSPYFSMEYKVQLLQKLFAGQVTELTLDFLQVVNKHNRMAYLSLISQEYVKLRDAYLGCRLVDVTLAKAISEQEIGVLRDEIAASFKSEIKLEVRVDPSIIGGIIIRRGDMVVDNTVKRVLREAVMAITSRHKESGTDS